jgi:prepilin-type N-terminal cleavage/methylation domain-containing protein
MKILANIRRKAKPGEKGFSLVEVMVGSAIFGLLVVALGSGMICAVALSELNDENLRATQILTEKMDLVRTLTWNQVTNGYNFLPQTFSTPYYSGSAFGRGNRATNSIVFNGSVSINNAPIAESYSNNLMQVTVSVTWTSAKVPRTRSMSTFVSPYGIANYSY